MIHLADGPVAGVYTTRAAPAFLRAVVGGRGRLDVLDQPEDEPRPLERIYVYRRVAVPNGFTCARGAGGGCFPRAEYAYLENVDGEALRDRGSWEAWLAAPSHRQLADATVSA